MALKYPRGTVVLVALVPDKNGGNHKDRPVVLVRDVEDTDALFCNVAVTSSFSYPVPVTSVKLPHHRQGRCKTGLTMECVADCT